MLDQLAEAALGWLGWSEDQLLFSDMNAIHVGMAGRRHLLQSIFGDPKKGKGNLTGASLRTPELFDALFINDKVN